MSKKKNRIESINFKSHKELRDLLSGNTDADKLNEIIDSISVQELSGFVQIKYDNQNRIDVLKMLYERMHTIHKYDESFENKITIYICTLMLAIAGYLLRFPINNPDTKTIIAILGFLGIITLVSIWMLKRNSKRIRLDSRLIVRIETALGLYSTSAIGIPSIVEKNEIFSKTDSIITSLFPTDLNSWGTTDKYLSLSPHIIAIILCSALSIFVVLNMN